MKPEGWTVTKSGGQFLATAERVAPDQFANAAQALETMPGVTSVKPVSGDEFLAGWLLDVFASDRRPWQWDGRTWEM